MKYMEVLHSFNNVIHVYNKSTTNVGDDSMFSFVIEVHCPLPTWANIELNTTATVYLSELKYYCDATEKLMFPDKSRIKTATCHLNGTWRPEIMSCTSMWTLNNCFECIETSYISTLYHCLVFAIYAM